MLLMRNLAVLALCCIFAGVQADFIVDFFSHYSPCANGVSDCRIGEQCVSCGHSNISGELKGRPIGKYCSGPHEAIPLCKSDVIRGRVMKTTAYSDDFLTCLVETCAETRQNPSELAQLTAELLRMRI